MADRAVFSLVIDAVERRLKTETTFPGVGAWGGIPPENIVVRDAKYTDEASKEDFKQDATPGIVISPGQAERPATYGTNIMDDVNYHVLAQVIDRSDKKFDRDRMDAHLLWCERIARTFHGHAEDSVEYGDGFHSISWSEQTSDIDERMFYRHERFVRGVILRFRFREPRGVQ